MIDKQTFKDEWTALCERFNRKPSLIETGRYFEYLNAHLDTEQFVQAAHRIYVEATFWPRPVDFVGTSTASVEWGKVQKLLRNRNSPLDSLTPAGQRAVRAMGGLARIGAIEADVHYRHKEFVELYEDFAAAPPEKLLPPSDESRRLLRKLEAI